MRILIRKLLAPILSKEARKKAKKIEYNIRRSLIVKLPPITEQAFHEIIAERLGVRRGSNIFVHASTGAMNTKVPAHRLLDILLDIVGPEGSVSAPTFIRYTSKEWMEMEKPFRVRRTPSGMGMLSEQIRRHRDSVRSLHPTKSVATIGPIAEDVLSTHHLSEYPFGPSSPFMKLLDHNVQVLGLGVTMNHLSLAHAVEDSNPESFPIAVNEPEVYAKDCEGKDGEIINVKTRVHNLGIITRGNSERFVRKYVPKDAYTIYGHYLTPFYSVNGQVLYQTLEKQMKENHTLYA